MSATESPNLSLPYIMAAQAQKHVTHNEAIRALDAIVQINVQDRDLAAPPPAPIDGDRYLVAAAPVGAWSGQAGMLAAFQDGAWAFHAPREGWIARVADENLLVIYNGSSWTPAGSGDPAGTAAALAGQAIQDVAELGINATADATNRLSVSSDAILFNHAGAGIQEKFNKNTATDTASLLFQTGFSGRAEIGTAGDDDLHVKVSPDGATWKEALVIDRASGAATFAYGAGQSQVDVFTASGTWSKPSWARTVEIWAIGGGAGGGSGRRGAAGSVRCGGGGGGAGGASFDTFLASEIGNTLTIAIGAGGNGGAAQTTNDANGNGGGGGGATTVADGGTVLLTGLGGSGSGGGSATGGAGSPAVASTYGAGNAGGVASATGGVGAGGNSVQWMRGPGSGGAGGGLSAANAASAGAAGGNGYALAGASARRAGGGTAGTATGGNGGAGSDKGWQRGAGAGGGSGGSGDSAGSISGGNGGAGGLPGGGGGAGGASANGANSGAGGNGGRGECWIICYA